MDIKQIIADYIAGKTTYLPKEAENFFNNIYSKCINSQIISKTTFCHALPKLLQLAEKLGCFDLSATTNGMGQKTTYSDLGTKIFENFIDSLDYFWWSTGMLGVNLLDNINSKLYKDKQVMDFLDKHFITCQKYYPLDDKVFMEEFLPLWAKHYQGDTTELNEFMNAYDYFDHELTTQILNNKAFMSKFASTINDQHNRRSLYDFANNIGCFTDHIKDNLYSYAEFAQEYNTGCNKAKHKMPADEIEFAKRYNHKAATDALIKLVKDERLFDLIWTFVSERGGYFNDNSIYLRLFVEDFDTLKHKCFEQTLDGINDFCDPMLDKLPFITTYAQLVNIAKNSKSSMLYPVGFLMLNSAKFLSGEFTEKEFKNNVYKFLNPELLQNAHCEDLENFYKFAKTIGCFSNKKILDAKGKETKLSYAHHACALLGKLLQNNVLTMERMHSIFNTLPSDLELDQDFLSFLNQQTTTISTVKGPTTNHNGKQTFQNQKIRALQYKNIETLLTMEQKSPGTISQIMQNWHEINQHKKYNKKTLDDGSTKLYSWEEAITTYFESKTYVNVQPGYENLALLLSRNRVNQQTFTLAQNTYIQAKKNKMPAHLLKQQLVEQIESQNQKIADDLQDAKASLNQAYKQNFTYEMLDKYDPRNAIIGIYASCCARLDNPAYGSDIALSTMRADDVQNIVINNKYGEIISKGAIYLNKKQGYAVINDFELNDKYKTHSTASGRYKDEKYPEQAQEREEIFQTFQRGINAFVQAYDKENPNNPLQYVVVGMGFNRLKKQCERFEKATKNFAVPAEYKFVDAMNEQYILYDRSKTLSTQNNKAETKML